jgi:hypothetical protein
MDYVILSPGFAAGEHQRRVDDAKKRRSADAAFRQLRARRQLDRAIALYLHVTEDSRNPLDQVADLLQLGRQKALCSSPTCGGGAPVN